MKMDVIENALGIQFAICRWMPANGEGARPEYHGVTVHPKGKRVDPHAVDGKQDASFRVVHNGEGKRTSEVFEKTRPVLEISFGDLPPYACSLDICGRTGFVPVR